MSSRLKYLPLFNKILKLNWRERNIFKNGVFLQARYIARI